MLYIKKFIVGYEDDIPQIEELKATIDIEKRIIKIKKSSYDIIIAAIHNGWGKCLKLYDDKNKEVLVNYLKYIKETPQYIFYNFELLIIGTHQENYLKNVEKLAVKFELLSAKKLFLDDSQNIQCTIENGINLLIKNDRIILNNMQLDEKIISQILTNIFEIIAIIYGSFPKIKLYEFITGKKKIYKYADPIGYLNSSNRENNKLKDFSYLKDFSKIYEQYVVLKETINRLPLQGFFNTQSVTQVYIDYKLSNLLQSIDGFSSVIYKPLIKENKRMKIEKKKNISSKIKEYLKSNKMEWNCSDEEYKEFCDSISHSVSKIEFKDFLEYLFDKEYSKKIFCEEINITEENNYTMPKEIFIITSVNERNRLSHMSYDKRKKYFTLNQLQTAYDKYSLLFRCMILEYLNIEFCL